MGKLEGRLFVGYDTQSPNGWANPFLINNDWVRGSETVLN